MGSHRETRGKGGHIVERSEENLSQSRCGLIF